MAADVHRTAWWGKDTKGTGKACSEEKPMEHRCCRERTSAGLAPSGTRKAEGLLQTAAEEAWRRADTAFGARDCQHMHYWTVQQEWKRSGCRAALLTRPPWVQARLRTHHSKRRVWVGEEKVLVWFALLKKKWNSQEHRKLNRKVGNEAKRKEGVKNKSKFAIQRKKIEVTWTLLEVDVRIVNISQINKRKW